VGHIILHKYDVENVSEGIWETNN